MSSLDRVLIDPDDPPSKREILACALRLFVRDGLCETSVRDIADASGYTNPALYKFFASKDALALAVFERCYRHVVAALRATQDPARELAANLDALLAGYARLLAEDAGAMLFVNEALRPLWPRVSPATRKLSLIAVTRGMIEAGQRDGVVAAELDLKLAVSVLIGGLAQVGRQVYFQELSLGPAQLASLHAMFLGALGVVGGARRRR